MRDFGGFSGLEDMFGMRGARSQRKSSRKAQPVRIRLSLTLAEVATGVTKTVKVALLDECGGATVAERRRELVHNLALIAVVLVRNATCSDRLLVSS